MAHKHTILALFLINVFVLLYSTYSTSALVYADTYPILGTLHAGKNPEALAIDENTHIVYIAFESPGVVVAFDSIHAKVLWRVALGEVVTDVQVDSSNHHVYATITSYSQRQGVLVILDGATGHMLASTLVSFGDNSIALDPFRHLVYVTNPDSGVVSMLTVPATLSANQRILRTELYVTPHPEALGVNSHLGRLYVADNQAHTITVIDENSGHSIATIVVGKVPLPPLRIDETTNYVYVVCSSSQEVDVIDGKTNRVIAHPLVPPYPEGVDISTSTGRIYVANEGTKEDGGRPYDTGTTLTVIDGHSFVTLGTLQIGKAPDGVVVDSTLHRVYVAAEDSDTVVEVADSTSIPLTPSGISQTLAARQASNVLQQAAIITFLLMLLTLVGATLLALSPRWRGRENPQTQQGGVSSRSETHSLPR